MHIALHQITAGADKMKNFEVVRAAAEKAASQGAELLVFPEATSQAFDTGRLDLQAENVDDGEFCSHLTKLAEQLDVCIVAGVFTKADEIEREGKVITRVANTAFITGRGLHEQYHKIHTYDAFGYRESDNVRAGKELQTFDLNGVKIGVAICYDIRFPALFQELAKQGAEVIVVPTSWQGGEGKTEQWRLLARARALDSSTWVLACDQAPPVNPQTSGPLGVGHSMVVNPYGVIQHEAGKEVAMLIADIDPELAHTAREAVGVLNHLP